MIPPVLLFTSLSNKYALYCAVKKQAKQFHPDSFVIATDSSANCPAANKVDFFVQSPETASWQEQVLLSFCQKHKITHIIPTRDGELKFWSSHAASLSSIGIHVMVSDPQSIATCLDKLSFSESCSQESPLQTIPTSLTPHMFSNNRIVVKERYGAGSRTMKIHIEAEDAKTWGRKLKNPIFQPFISGKELSAETWIDRKGKCHGMLLRWRQKVVNGEAVESEVFEDLSLESKLKHYLHTIPGLYGHCLTQVLIDKDGMPHVIEINPRLGGASALGLHAGIHSIRWFLEESSGLAEKIPEAPEIHFGAKLLKEGDAVRIIDPFPSRQKKSED